MNNKQLAKFQIMTIMKSQNTNDEMIPNSICQTRTC